MKIDIITLFPELFEPFREWSMIKKARSKKILQLEIHNLRRWALDKYGTVDDHPYGGGPGMILRVEPVYHALKDLKALPSSKNTKVVLLSAKGKTLTQQKAQKLAQLPRLVLICGHYEGVDERIRLHLVNEDISIGNYILSGGELAAMVLVDVVNRLLPGVLKTETAWQMESFSPGLEKIKGQKTAALLEYPQYTRPANFQGWKVPKVLLSGNHQQIYQWRRQHIKIKK